MVFTSRRRSELPVTEVRITAAAPGTRVAVAAGIVAPNTAPPGVLTCRPMPGANASSRSSGPRTSSHAGLHPFQVVTGGRACHEWPALWVTKDTMQAHAPEYPSAYAV